MKTTMAMNTANTTIRRSHTPQGHSLLCSFSLPVSLSTPSMFWSATCDVFWRTYRRGKGEGRGGRGEGEGEGRRTGENRKGRGIGGRGRQEEKTNFLHQYICTVEAKQSYGLFLMVLQAGVTSY